MSGFKRGKLENIILGIRNFEFLFEAILCVLLYVYMQDSTMFIDIPFWLSVFVCLIVAMICFFKAAGKPASKNITSDGRTLISEGSLRFLFS